MGLPNGSEYAYKLMLQNKYPDGTAVSGYITFEVDGFMKVYGAINDTPIFGYSPINVEPIEKLTKLSPHTGITESSAIFYVAS